jgi:hypothetical protein
LAAESRFIPTARVFVDRSLFDGFVDRRESERQEFFCFFPIFIVNGCSYGFDACSQDGLIFSVDQIAAEGSSPLPYGRLVLCHFLLLD